jgi:protein-disulfide isomerase
MATSMKNDIVQTDQVFIGFEDAPVTIKAYIDYESAECALLNEILKELLNFYNGKIRINFRHFPQANKHQKAMKAAEAAVAAAQENLFWPMHNLMFENRKKLGTISLKAYAKEVGSTNKRFLDQLVNGTYAWQVREDLIEALNEGVRKPPAVFINEHHVVDNDITSLHNALKKALEI